VSQLSTSNRVPLIGQSLLVRSQKSNDADLGKVVKRVADLDIDLLSMSKIQVSSAKDL